MDLDRDEERRAALLETLTCEEKAPFTGWDFSRVAGRMSTTPLPWSFERIAGDALRSSRATLDLGTGGGDRLAALVGQARGPVLATESYPPNVPVARARLEPLGVQVIHSKGFDLPFGGARFDLVMSRHTGFRASEVARVLRPQGWFVTQQVDRGSAFGIREALGCPVSPTPDRSARLVAQCEDAGLAVEQVKDAVATRRFEDIEALVYYLRAVPWAVPGFSVEAYFERLLGLQDQVKRGVPLTFPMRFCLLVARRAVV